jgi:hypothetical protein
MKYLRKKLIEAPYAGAGASPIIKMPLGGKILESRLIITGQITLAGGAAGAVIGEGLPAELFRRIQLYGVPLDPRYRGGNGLPLLDCSVRSLLNYAITQRGKKINELMGITCGNGAAGVYDIFMCVPIFWANANMKRNNGTALNSDAYSSLQLKLDLVSSNSDVAARCIEGYAGTVDFSQLQLIYEDDRAFVTGDTFCLVQEDHDLFVPNAQPQLVDQGLPIDGTLLEMLIQAESEFTTTRTLADTILNKVRITADQLDYEKRWQEIRQQMFDDEWYDASQNAAGQFFIDFANGSFANGLNLATLSHYYNVENPSGSMDDVLRIYTRRAYAPLPNQANSTPYTPAAF